MAGSPGRNRRFGSIILSVACIGVAAAVAWSVIGKRTDSQAIAAPGEVTGSIVGFAYMMEFFIACFVSLKAEKVNVRRGPSSDHPVAWVFQRKGLPVEIVAEFENWRRVRDSDGEEGWILQNMLSGKRTAVIAPWKQGQTVPLLANAQPGAGLVAQAAAGVLAEVEGCNGQWCQVDAGSYDGFVEQTQLWGVYPGEKVD